MAFSDFKTVEHVLRKYPLRLKREKFLPDIHLALPSWFINNLNFALKRQAVQESEIFFRESFIFPFLQQTWQGHDKLKLWVNQALVYDDVLFGEPDYLVSMWPEGVIDRLVNKPLLAVMEAKKQDFEGGWGQCLAVMLACQQINADEPLTIYGIVSTGLTWRFGKLEGNVFTEDLLSYSIDTPERVFGLLDYIFGQCEEQLLYTPA